MQQSVGVRNSEQIKLEFLCIGGLLQEPKIQLI